MATMTINFLSNCLMRRVDITAVIPSDVFDMQTKTFKKQEPYRTLYLLHGIKGSPIDWLTLTNVRRFAEDTGIAVIMPAGNNSFYIDDEDLGLYSTFISEELVAFTRNTFNLSTKREDTYIAGCSMGGFGALYNGLLSNYFSVIGALSPAIMNTQSLKDVEDSSRAITPLDYHITCFRKVEQIENSQYDLKKIVKEKVDNKEDIPYMYLAIGTDDYLYQHSVDFDAFLNELNIPHTYYEATGAHTWAFWNEHLEKFMHFLNEK